MQIISSLLINAAIYSALLFNEQIVCQKILTSLYNARKQEQSDTATGDDNNNSSNSRVSKRQLTYDPVWSMKYDGIRIDSDGIVYYPIGKIQLWGNKTQDKPSKIDSRLGNIVFNADSNGPESSFTPGRDTVMTDPSYIRNMTDKTAKSTLPPVSTSDESQIVRSNEMISSVKCREYAERVWRAIKKSSTKMNCLTANQLIAGGSIASQELFAHMASLGKRATDGTFVHLCGGSLISDRWILTAAHCTDKQNGPTIVRLGIRYSLQDQNSGVTIPIKRTIRHPAYKTLVFYDDIALIELQRAVAFGMFIRPACLNQRYNVPLKAWISGWGASEYGGKPTNELRHARLDILDISLCVKHYNTSRTIPYGVTSSMICAGDPKGSWKKDTCPGDSGGPLQIMRKMDYCMWRSEILGVTSFGEPCVSTKFPSVYVRVSHYLDWIENIVWPDESHLFRPQNSHLLNL